MKIKHLVAPLLFLFSHAVLAQSYDNQVWINISGQGPFKEKSNWGGYLELQTRHSEDQKRNYENIIRPAIFYKTEEMGNFHLGYLTRSNYRSDEVERRPWAQWSKTYSIDAMKISTRARFESRDLGLEERSQRVRLMLRIVNSEFSFSEFTPLASAEFFFNLNDVKPSIKQGMKQSRLSIGVNRKIEETLAFDLIYMKNLIDVDSGEDQDNNVLQINLIKDF